LQGRTLSLTIDRITLELSCTTSHEDLKDLLGSLANQYVSKLLY